MNRSLLNTRLNSISNKCKFISRLYTWSTLANVFNTKVQGNYVNRSNNVV